MNLLMLKELFEDAEGLPTFRREAMILLPADLIFHDIRELLLK